MEERSREVPCCIYTNCLPKLLCTDFGHARAVNNFASRDEVRDFADYGVELCPETHP